MYSRRRARSVGGGHAARGLDAEPLSQVWRGQRAWGLGTPRRGLLAMHMRPRPGWLWINRLLLPNQLAGDAPIAHGPMTRRPETVAAQQKAVADRASSPAFRHRSFLLAGERNISRRAQRGIFSRTCAHRPGHPDRWAWLCVRCYSHRQAHARSGARALPHPQRRVDSGVSYL